MNANLLNELKQHVGEFEGRLVWLEDSLADLGYGSHFENDLVKVFDDNDNVIAEIAVEIIKNDEVKVTEIEAF